MSWISQLKFEQAINLQIQRAVAAALQSILLPGVNVAPTAAAVQRQHGRHEVTRVLHFEPSHVVQASCFLMKLPEAVVVSARSLINEIQPTDADA
jgi:hypothetical protein